MSIVLKVFEITTKFHGITRFHLIDRLVEYSVKMFLSIYGIERFREKYVSEFKKSDAYKKFSANPEDFLQYMAIVQAPYIVGKSKGVITIAYNYAFPCFLALFDINKVLQRYHIVLEPSTARLLMPEVLLFEGLSETVFIQSGEPRDSMFLKRFSKNIVPMPIAANWWLNKETFYEDPDETKTYDFIMVSSFTILKRHQLLFKAMRELNNRGIKTTACLVGYEGRYTSEDIRRFSEQEGISDRVTIIKDVTPQEVAHYYRRSKINVLLSKREGYNRSIIEGLYCNLPIVLREGFNFGYKYDFISPESGAYYKDANLADVLESVLNSVNENKLTPAKTIGSLGIGPSKASKIISRTIFGTEDKYIAPKESGLHGMEYISTKDRELFQEDYCFLSSKILPPQK